MGGIEMINQEVRNLAKSKGFNYDLVTREKFDLLINILNVELKNHKEMPMKTSKVLKNDFIFDRKGMIRCFIKVNGPYFKNREAISFNEDGFIGFCGWASENNAIPIINSFNRWLETF